MPQTLNVAQGQKLSNMVAMAQNGLGSLTNALSDYMAFGNFTQADFDAVKQAFAIIQPVVDKLNALVNAASDIVQDGGN